MAKSAADVASPVDEKLVTAKAALNTFKTLCPDLSIFATVLAGRDPEKSAGPRCRLTVVPGLSTATDGTKIFIRPDARLAGTPTEAEWSSIKAGLFHEVAHIVFDSFKAVSERDRMEAIKVATDALEDSYRRDALLKALSSASANYKSMSEAWHPAMPMLVNALEDARVEACLFLAKPGTHKHLLASRMEIFDAPKAEIEALIGTAWVDRDDDSQAIIGAYIVGAGYDPAGRLSEKIVKILQEMTPVIRSAVEVESVSDVYARSFGVLSAFQKNGLLRNGDERDEPIGTTDHPDEMPAEVGDAGSSACPHPKAMIVECSSPGCEGNCTLCGTHIVKAVAAAEGDGDKGDGTEEGGESSASTGDGKGGEGFDPEDRGSVMRGDAVTALEDSEAADDGGEISGGGAADLTDEATRGGGSKAMDGAASTAGTSAEDATEEVHRADEDSLMKDAEDEAARIEAERAEAARMKEMEEGLHVAGGHDADGGEAKLDSGSLERALSLDEHGYGDDEDLTKGITALHRYASNRNFFIDLPESITKAVDLTEAERAINTVMPEMRQALALNGRTGFTPNQRAGRIDTRQLYKTATGATRVFGRYSTPETREYQFVIALDCSGSMSGGMSKNAKLQKALAFASGEMLNRLGIPFLMFGYSGSTHRGGYALQIQDLRAEGEPWDADAIKRLGGLSSSAANLDGSTMQYARIRGRNACRSPKTEVVVLYMNDGGMPAENSRNEERIIRKEVRQQKSHNTRFVGIGLNSDAAGRAGLDLVLCRDVGDVQKVTRKIAETMGGIR